MKWTDKKPTSYGYYAWRSNEKATIHQSLARVYESKNELFISFQDDLKSYKLSDCCERLWLKIPD